MKNLLKQLKDTEAKIYSWFGTSTSWYGIEDMTDEFWDTDGSSVWWSDEEVHFTDPESEPSYAEDIINHNVYDVNGYTMMNLHCSTGDKGTYIFDNTKRRHNEYNGF